MHTKMSAARIASLDAYDRWKAANRSYERVLDALRDEHRMSDAIARGHHLNLCVLVAMASARVETACKRLVTKLDLQDWFEDGASASKPGPSRFSQRAPCR